MKIDIRAQKLMLCGINGSGKTNAGFYLSNKQFKRFVFFTPHVEDIDEAPKNAIKVPATKLTAEELEEVAQSVKRLAMERKIDGFVVDDLDVFIKDENDLLKAPTFKDLMINHRHWGKKSKEDPFGLGLICMTRRPQNVPASVFENFEYYMFYSSPTSDNVKRKYNAIHKDLYEQVQELVYKEYKFVIKRVGEDPKTFDPLPLSNKSKKTPTKLKEQANNDNTKRKRTIADDES